MNTLNQTIIDLYGNTIEITHLEDAISQAKGGSSVTVTQSPFSLESGNSVDIKGREDELSTLGEYWTDALEKLNNLKKGIETTWSLACNKYGFNEYDVTHPIIHRAKVLHGIKNGDIFNAYYGESSKTGLVWQGTLTQSINDAWYAVQGYKIRYNPATVKFHVSHEEIGVIGDYDDLEDAIKDCKKG